MGLLALGRGDRRPAGDLGRPAAHARPRPRQGQRRSSSPVGSSTRGHHPDRRTSAACWPAAPTGRPVPGRRWRPCSGFPRSRCSSPRSPSSSPAGRRGSAGRWPSCSCLLLVVFAGLARARAAMIARPGAPASRSRVARRVATGAQPGPPHAAGAGTRPGGRGGRVRGRPLAGGTAIAAVRPWWSDVVTGVPRRPGDRSTCRRRRAARAGAADRRRVTGWRWSPPTRTPTGFRSSTSSSAPDDARVELIGPVPRGRPGGADPGRICYAAGRFEREIHDLYGITPRATPSPPAGPARALAAAAGTRCARDARPGPGFEPDVGLLPVPRGPGRRGLRDPRRTDPRRPHRAWPLPVLGRRRDHPADEGPALVRAPRHREALRGTRPGRGHRARRADQRRHRGRPHPRVRHGGRGRARDRGGDDDRPVGRCCSSSSGCTTTSATSARSPTTSASASPTPTPSGCASPCCGTTRPLTGHRLLRGGDHARRRRPARCPRPGPGRTPSPTRSPTSSRSPWATRSCADRFTGTAVLSREAAASIGTLGYVARASGLDVDARRDHPFVDLGPYFAVVESTTATCSPATRSGPGRSAVSARWSPTSPTDGRSRAPAPARAGRRPTPARAGRARRRRGLARHPVPPGRAGRRRAAHPGQGRRPPFFNWPALPVALTDTIVPDFPLANKSFNQSYAGQRPVTRRGTSAPDGRAHPAPACFLRLRDRSRRRTTSARRPARGRPASPRVRRSR